MRKYSNMLLQLPNDIVETFYGRVWYLEIAGGTGLWQERINSRWHSVR